MPFQIFPLVGSAVQLPANLLYRARVPVLAVHRVHTPYWQFVNQDLQSICVETSAPVCAVAGSFLGLIVLLEETFRRGAALDFWVILPASAVFLGFLAGAFFRFLDGLSIDSSPITNKNLVGSSVLAGILYTIQYFTAMRS